MSMRARIGILAAVIAMALFLVAGCESILGITDSRIAYWKNQATACEQRAGKAEKKTKQAEDDYASVLHDFTKEKEDNARLDDQVKRLQCLMQDARDTLDPTKNCVEKPNP